MSNKVFLVDYENTAIRGLNGIDELERGSKVVVFCSNEAVMESLESILKVYEEARGLEIKLHFLAKRGNNALDFMITTYLGYEISKEELKEIYILSKDRGYTTSLELAQNIRSDVKIGFGESIYWCLHEEEKENDEASKNIISADNEEISVKEIIDNAVAKIEKAKTKKQNQKDTKAEIKIDNAKKQSQKNVKARTKKEKTADILQKIKADGEIPSQYTTQLAAVVVQSTSINDFKNKALKMFGKKKKDYAEMALKYYKLNNE